MRLGNILSKAAKNPFETKSFFFDISLKKNENFIEFKNLKTRPQKQFEAFQVL